MDRIEGGCLCGAVQRQRPSACHEHLSLLLLPAAVRAAH